MAGLGAESPEKGKAAYERAVLLGGEDAGTLGLRKNLPGL
jgi:hypothetical protein